MKIHLSSDLFITDNLLKTVLCKIKNQISY